MDLGDTIQPLTRPPCPRPHVSPRSKRSPSLVQKARQGPCVGSDGGSYTTAQLAEEGCQGWPRQGSGRPENPPCPAHVSSPQVAGTWFSVAMAASDIGLLNTQRAPLRVYVKELRPTPENNLEIVLHRWWVS